MLAVSKPTRGDPCSSGSVPKQAMQDRLGPESPPTGLPHAFLQHCLTSTCLTSSLEMTAKNIYLLIQSTVINSSLCRALGLVLEIQQLMRQAPVFVSAVGCLVLPSPAFKYKREGHTHVSLFCPLVWSLVLSCSELCS